MERIIRVEKENQEQEIKILQEGAEQEIVINLENQEQEVPVEKEALTIGSAPYVNDHSKLNKLGFEESGHIGFQEEMDSITNLEIERMWNSVWITV